MPDMNNSSAQAGANSVAVGSVSVGGSIDGSLIIGSHNVVGFSSDQVSTLMTQISTTFQVKPFDGRCPHKELDVFNEADSELFFGREKWVENLMGRVKESCTLSVTGPSGSGKSSLVRVALQCTASILGRDILKYAYIKNLYSKRFPEAQQFFSLGDFNLWELTPKSGRFVAGFAQEFNLVPDYLKRVSAF